MNQHQRQAREHAYKGWLSWIEQETIGGRRAAIRQSALMPAWLAVERKLGESLPPEPAEPEKPSPDEAARRFIAEIDRLVAMRSDGSPR